MRVLVTGGAGFVGSHVVDALCEAGSFAVVVLDNLSTGRRENTRAPIVEDDVTNENVDVSCEFDAIVHCAAIADIAGNWRSGADRARLWRVNVDGTRRMLECAPSGCDFVFVSTLAAQGDETSPYSASKIAGEALVRAYTDARRVRGHVVRLPSCVGPRYRHGHVADFANAAFRDRIVRPRDNGSVRKPFIHVADAAREIVQRLVDKGDGPFLRVARAGYLWSCLDTLAIMRTSGRHKFDVEYEKTIDRGWVGDPHDFGELASIVDPREVRRSIAAGVVEALAAVGW